VKLTLNVIGNEGQVNEKRQPCVYHHKKTKQPSQMGHRLNGTYITKTTFDKSKSLRIAHVTNPPMRDPFLTCCIDCVIPVSIDTRKKYDSYDVKVDPDQEDKATEIKLFSFRRPHMRAFHVCWWSFFMAFFVWFAVAPLYPKLEKH
jgi:hypothetical protein